MNFIKFFLMTMVFVVTGANVMAADDYAVFGGKDVKFSAAAPQLGLTDKTGGTFDLELSNDIYSRLKKVDAGQFSKDLARNAVTVVKGIYESISKAVQTGEGLSDEQSLTRWLTRHAAKAADRTIRLNFTNIKTLATVTDDNKAAVNAFSTHAGWGAVEASNAAAELAALNGTPGAIRRATTGEYANAQAAHDAYVLAAAKKSGPDAATGLAEAKAALVRARALRFGTNGRNIAYLADKETSKTFDAAAVRAAKARVAARKEVELATERSKAGITPDQQVSIDAYRLLMGAIDDGDLSVLTVDGSAVDDSARFAASAGEAGKLVTALVDSLAAQRVLRNDIVLLGQQVALARAEQVAASIAASSKKKFSASSGPAASGVLSGDDGMPLFDFD